MAVVAFPPRDNDDVVLARVIGGQIVPTPMQPTCSVEGCMGKCQRRGLGWRTKCWSCSISQDVLQRRRESREALKQTERPTCNVPDCINKCDFGRKSWRLMCEKHLRQRNQPPAVRTASETRLYYQRIMTQARNAMFGLGKTKERNWAMALKLFKLVAGQLVMLELSDEAVLLSYFLKQESPPEQHWIEHVHKVVAKARTGNGYAFLTMGFIFMGRFGYGPYQFYNAKVARWCFEQGQKAGIHGCDNLIAESLRIQRAPKRLNINEENLKPLVRWLMDNDVLQRNDVTKSRFTPEDSEESSLVDEEESFSSTPLELPPPPKRPLVLVLSEDEEEEEERPIKRARHAEDSFLDGLALLAKNYS